MGDYCKLIVSCSIKKSAKKELKKELKELSLGLSFYHSQEKIISIKQNEGYQDRLDIVIIGQTKYGRGMDDFIDWLKPKVVQGSGPQDTFAMIFSEYSTDPVIYKLENLEE